MGSGSEEDGGVAAGDGILLGGRLVVGSRLDLLHVSQRELAEEGLVNNGGLSRGLAGRGEGVRVVFGAGEVGIFALALATLLLLDRECSLTYIFRFISYKFSVVNRERLGRALHKAASSGGAEEELDSS